MAIQPVLLLTFSNDQDQYLPMIVAEQKAIKQALLDQVDKNYLEIRDVQHASTEEIFYLVNRYHQRLYIFHYGGHADQKSLQLEQEVGVVQTANARGIAGLLGTQQQLKLVFLNGCATAGQVKILLDQGVPAVIATRVAINDREAQRFSAQFYQALAGGSTLGEAFRKAKAFIETSREDLIVQENPLGRGIVLEKLKPDEAIPWGLYFKPDQGAVLDWKLPTESPLEVNFDHGQWKNRWESPVNDLLVNESLKAIRESEIVKDLARKIHQERRAGNSGRTPTDAEKKDALVRAYPAPISVHLRALFSKRLSAKYDEARLSQLLVTYQKILEFLTSILLSDIWDQSLKTKEGLDLSTQERLQLEAFFDLNSFTAPAFDHFLLIDALLQLGGRNKLPFYVKELQQYPNGWAASGPMEAVHAHFQNMRTALESDIPSRLIEEYGMASEQRLTELLEALHFLVYYKMAVVKNIEVKQLKNMPPTAYRHIIVELDNNYQDMGEKDRQQELDRPTDMESILLYRESLGKSLNLSPFLLDENALIREYNSKMYSFAYRSTEGLHFEWIENEKDTLEITHRSYPHILEQFERARQDILQEKINAKIAANVNDDDILSVI